MRLPAWMTLPITTLPTRAASRPERRNVSRTTVAPSSVAGVPFKAPLKVPIAVRTGRHKTTSRDGIGSSSDSVWLSGRGSQVTPDPHYGGVSRLSAHRKAHGTGQPKHGLVGGEDDARSLAQASGSRVLEQGVEQPAAETLALPRVGEHERYIGTVRRSVDDIAPDADELLDTVDHGGHSEGHVAVIVDVGHGIDPLGRHLRAAAQHALVARFERKPADERLFELVVVADRAHAQRVT